MSSDPINSKQRAVLLVGGIILGVMLLFPPWLDRYARAGSGYNQTGRGYGFIFYPPQHANQIDTTRLFVQFLAVGFIFGSIFVYVKGGEKIEQSATWWKCANCGLNNPASETDCERCGGKSEG